MRGRVPAAARGHTTRPLQRLHSGAPSSRTQAGRHEELLHLRLAAWREGDIYRADDPPGAPTAPAPTTPGAGEHPTPHGHPTAHGHRADVGSGHGLVRVFLGVLVRLAHRGVRAVIGYRPARHMLVLHSLSAVVAAGWLWQAAAPPPAAPGISPPPLAVSLPHVSVTPLRPRVTGYDRDNFGHGWATGADGCSTRDHAIAEHIPGVHIDGGCTPRGGEGICPYTGETISSRGVELDHVFPLSAAWDLGAAAWTAARRIEFANDPDNLIVVTKASNREKSDQLPGQWMPPAPGAGCWYARRVALIAARYELQLAEEDVAAMRRACGVRELLPKTLG
ncbi:DUF1524 domain-containing protein [Corynebacterium sp. 13CS0277]|uniref:GmrSD restriction endonuclease domain-containing protein n=1 Tax=Corynebacterium sp. 13CS0277 TaxID=2071994 RepID=UPI001304E382|nr:DUF1524 domain-containing protein [Corynebacterium sp. 13CS0277]